MKTALIWIFHRNSLRGAAQTDVDKEGDGLRRRLYLSCCQRSNLRLTQYTSGSHKPQQNYCEMSWLAKIFILLIILLITFPQIKAEGLIPEEWQWQYLGYIHADPTMLAPNHSGLKLLECYQQGIDPREAVEEQSATLNLSAAGPYHAPANVVLVIAMPHPEMVSRVDFYDKNQCIGTLSHPVLKEYEFSLGDSVSSGHYAIEAHVYDLAENMQPFTTEFDVFPANRYVRGIGSNQNYLSSLIALDQERGDFLDRISDFSLIYGSNYPWFLRSISEINVPCQHILDPALYVWPSPTKSPYGTINFLPVLNGKVVGGEPPMIAFGSSAGNGTPLFVNQDYHFGIIAGRPSACSALKIEVYEKSDFDNGAVNVLPVLTQTNNLPSTSIPEELDALKKQFYIQDYHLMTVIHGKVVDFDTKVQYQFGGMDQTWGNNSFVTPLIVTHQSANDLFYYKVSFKGDAPSLDGKAGVSMAYQVDQQGQHLAYNLTYTLNFNELDSWATMFMNEPHFQDVAMPSSYEGKSLDELLHQTSPIQDTLPSPDPSLWHDLIALDQTPELKKHPLLDELVDHLTSDGDLNNRALHIANYVQNHIELTDAVGLSQIKDPISLNSQGVMRDALGTYLEGQGSPIEQCALLIYLLRKSGIPAGYIFPSHDTTLMFDQPLSAMLHMQLRGTANMLGQTAGIPELIPVNYPWVAAYINGKWIHLFPWIKDTEVKEGGNIWNYFPNNYKDARQWLCHYLQGDLNIRSLSQEDNVATLFPLYAQEQLSKKNLTLEDVGIRFRNRQHLYQNWEEFPRPWQTSIINNSNLVDHLSDDFFDTINIQIFSDRNHNSQPDPGEPILETGSLRFADLHDRRLLLYHQIIPETMPPQYEMILSLEAYDSTPGSHDATTTHAFAGDVKNPDPGDFRSAQKISTKLFTAANPSDAHDDALSYKITRTHHKQAATANKTYLAQFPTLIEEMDSIVDLRPLRKGDMAVLSLNYGRVTEEMKNFELKKYLDYQRDIQEHPEVGTDPEIATGQLLQLMGKTYYYHLSQFQQQLEEWTKVHAISYRAHGLTKLSPEHGIYGPLTNTNHGSLDFNLCYPKVDMSFQRAVLLGNQSAHLESGANTQAGAQWNELFAGEASAQEHQIIDEFFNQADAISTVKLLDLTREQGNEILVLREDNYQVEKMKSLANYSACNDINGFVELWNHIDSFFESNKNDPFATVFLTPQPVTAVKQQGTPYRGMGAFSVSSTSAAAWITDRMLVANGGFGGMMNIPICSQRPETSTTMLIPTFNGGFSFSQNNLQPPSGTLPLNNFQKLHDQIATGSQTVTPDVMQRLTLWNYTVNQVIGARDSVDFKLKDSGSQAAALLRGEMERGNLGTTSYYTSSSQAIQEGVWKLVHDPVNVITGEYYINAQDMKLNGPMPLEVRRIYGSQSDANNNFGYGWKLGYFPYLLLSNDENETTSPSLIYAAEPDGSVIAYRYQSESKSWMPTIADNPELVNNNDGSHLVSRNHFNNRIIKTKEDTYQLTSCDGAIRTFIVRSFPVVGSSDIQRKRPYLDSWKDVNGNDYHFRFGQNRNANDYGQLNLITSSNGSNLRFCYDPYGHIVEAFSSDGRQLKYSYDCYGDLIKVTLPDGSTISYQYQHASEGDESNKKIYSTHLITQVTKPDGRILKNDYDEKRRVITQYATEGLSPKPEITARFQYDLKENERDKTLSGKTSIKNANGYPTIYEIAQHQITAIHFPENRNVTQAWTFDSGFKALASYIDRRGLVTTFDYDAKGNLIHKTVSGNLTGNNHASESATTQFSYNDKNLLTTKVDQLGSTIHYDYDDQAHPCSPTNITKIADGKLISMMKFSYQNFGRACGLLAELNFDGAITSNRYDTHGFLTSMIQKTGTHDPDVVTNYTSNERGEIVAVSWSDGSQEKYFYDALDHLTGVETYDKNSNLIDWHFNYYNQNGEIEWEQGALSNPTNWTYYDHDRAGNLLHKASCLNAGLATTSYEYDRLGNCLSATDPKGRTTTMSYDGIGEMLSRTQGRTESFTYEPGGKIATHHTLLGGEEFYSYTSAGLLQSASGADGTTFQYRYDLSGRLVQEILPNKSYWKVTYDGHDIMRTFCDANGNSLGSIFERYDGRGNLLEQTDLAGYQWCYSYDGLERIKTEQGPPTCANTAQQRVTHIYDLNETSTINEIGERTTQFFDALGRLILTTIFNKDGTMAKNIRHEYAANHQSFMTTTGTGEHAITTTTFVDEEGRPLMIKHADGTSQKWSYDLNGNMTFFTDEEGNKTAYVYDAFDHLASKMRPDGTVIKYSYNELGELLTRSMPQGLIEQNSYDVTGKKRSSSLIGSDGSITRQYTYDYDQGLLCSVNDPRGGKIEIEYDVWNHPTKVSSTGFILPEQNQITTYAYDIRGLITGIAQQYSDPSTGSSTLVSRSYDAYGQLISETTSLNEMNIAAWSQTWNGAGRRVSLNWTLDHQGKGAQYDFSYNALGLITEAHNASGSCSYTYGDHGLLLSEITPAGVKSLQRDQQGRIIHQTFPDQSQESIVWKSDGKIKSYSSVGSAANETRNYEYDFLGHLMQEPYTLAESSDPSTLSVGTHTATYAFDQLGVRIKQEVTPEIQNNIVEKNSFSQVIRDDLNNGVNKTYSWNSFYDAVGAVTARSIEEGINQDLTWDGIGRLVGVHQRNKNDQGYNWKTTYDGLGRRLQTSYCDARGNQTTSGALTIQYYYDPEVEFLELGHDYFGRTWNLYGPDRSGFYGGAQGIGGLVSTTAENHDEVHGVVNNFFGDSIGITTGGVFQPWGNVLGGYGAMPGSSVNPDLVPQWRDHYLDWTGFYYMGIRYYEPKSGRFLSPDSLGHSSSLSLYDYCDGDPVNGLDPDGRCVEYEYLGLNETGRENFDYMLDKAFHAPSIQDGVHALGGVALGFADLNIFYSFGSTPQGAVNFVGNGANMNDRKISEMTQLSGEYLRLSNSKDGLIGIKNPTHGLFFDLIRCVGQNLRATDITSLKAADALNAAGPGKINTVMFSNATALFGGAMPFVRPQVRARINFQGFGGQWNINQNVYGLKRVNNIRHSLDLVPLLTPWNWFQLYDVIEKGDSFDWKEPLKFHNFKNIYAPQITPIQ